MCFRGVKVVTWKDDIEMLYELKYDNHSIGLRYTLNALFDKTTTEENVEEP